MVKDVTYPKITTHQPPSFSDTSASKADLQNNRRNTCIPSLYSIWK